MEKEEEKGKEGEGKERKTEEASEFYMRAPFE